MVISETPVGTLARIRSQVTFSELSMRTGRRRLAQIFANIEAPDACGKSQLTPYALARRELMNRWRVTTLKFEKKLTGTESSRLNLPG